MGRRAEGQRHLALSAAYDAARARLTRAHIALASAGEYAWWAELAGDVAELCGRLAADHAALGGELCDATPTRPPTDRLRRESRPDWPAQQIPPPIPEDARRGRG